MRISQAKEVIKELYLKTNIVTALVSERGVGKTSAYQQSAEELGIDYIGLYAAALEGPDFMGLPAKDLEKGITRYLAPQFLPTEEAIKAGLYKEKGLIVLEEINRVPSDTISVLYPLLLESKINGHQLGKGWRIGVTMNPDTLNYMVNALDDAMLDRFISIEINPTVDDYVAYSRSHQGNEQVLGFLTDFPDMLLKTNSASESGLLSKSPTPRGWTKVQEIMNTCDLPEALMNELISGIVGPIATSAFLGYLGKLKVVVPSARGILEDYTKERPKVLKVLDEQYTPVLTKVIENVIAMLDEQEAMVDAVDLFMADLPDEMKMYFYKLLNRENEDLFDFFNDRSMMFEEVGDQLIDRLAR
jgi:hypothetical protein